MIRNITAELNKWYQSGASTPLLITGARGVGKTETLRETADNSYLRIIYMNFEDDMRIAEAFSGLAPDAGIEDALSSVLNIEREYLNGFLFIFDEFTFCNAVGNILDAVNGDEGLHIICLTSFELKAGFKAFTRLKMHPMSFTEFLSACDKDWYADIIEGHFEKFKSIPDMIHEEISDLFDDYMHTGGMPEAVYEYLRTREYEHSFASARPAGNIYNYLICDLKHVFADEDVAKARQLIEHIPENTGRRYRYGSIRKGLCYNDFSGIIGTLERNGMILARRRIEISGTNEYEFRENMVKLSYNDHGVLRYCLGAFTSIDEEEEEARILNNYAETVLNNSGIESAYWESEYQSSIDFIIMTGDGIIPAEVRTENNIRSKALRIFESKYQPEMMLRFGRDNFSRNDKIRNIPLYSLECLKKYGIPRL